MDPHKKALNRIAGLLLAGLLAFLQAPAVLAGQESTELQSIMSPMASASLLLDATLAGERLVAVGQRGHVVYSDDKGQSWQQAVVPTRQLLTAVFFVDAQHGWAVGHDAQILATTDAGATWTLQYEDPERYSPLMDIWFSDRNNGFALGAYGTFLHTRDGGKNWEEIAERLDNEDELHLNAISPVQGGGLMIAGEMGMLFRSADLGETWETLESPYEGSFFGLQALNQPGAVLVFGLRGTVLRSDDFGQNWQAAQVQGGENGPFKFGLSGSTRLSDSRLVLVGHAGSVLFSNDEGQSFSVTSTPDRQSLSAVVDAGEKLILFGQDGVQQLPLSAALPAEKSQ